MGSGRQHPKSACWCTKYFKMKEFEKQQVQEGLRPLHPPLKQVIDLKKISLQPIFPNKTLENATISKENLNHLSNHCFLELQVV